MNVMFRCNRCAREYEKALDIPTRLECSACGGDVLTSIDEDLVLCHVDTRDVLGNVQKGRPFGAYQMKLPKTVILMLGRVVEKVSRLEKKKPEPRVEEEEEKEDTTSLDSDNFPIPGKRTRRRST